MHLHYSKRWSTRSLRKEPVQKLAKDDGAVLKAHIDDIFAGANSLKATLKLLEELFDTLVKYNCRLRIDKCESLKSILEYLGFAVGDGWWDPSSAKIGPLSRIHLDTHDPPQHTLEWLQHTHERQRHSCVPSTPDHTLTNPHPTLTTPSAHPHPTLTTPRSSSAAAHHR